MVSEPGSEARPPVAVITGATGGIGSAVVKRLLREGYWVSGLARNQVNLDALDRDVGHHVNFWRHACDVTSMKDVSACVARLERIDLLVTCHGASPRIKPSVEVTDEDWKAVHDVDVLGTFHVCQTAGRVMLAQGAGNVVLLTSVHGSHATYPGRVVYSSAKSAIIGMMRGLAVEWGPSGIRVNAISPWQIDTPRTQTFIDLAHVESGEDLLELYKQKSPLRQLVTVEDIAESVIYLTRNKSMTGQVITVDAGVTASMWYKSFLEV